MGFCTRCAKLFEDIVLANIIKRITFFKIVTKVRFENFPLSNSSVITNRKRCKLLKQFLMYALKFFQTLRDQIKKNLTPQLTSYELFLWKPKLTSKTRRHHMFIPNRLVVGRIHDYEKIVKPNQSNQLLIAF